ncbi:MAG: MurT ligase domain-containing protein [Nanoarchaeota archaeon]
MDFKLFLAILVGKLTSFLIKLKGGGATAAPGLYALYIDPNLVKKLAKKNGLNSIVISGTNGKTTTARLVSDILGTKYKIIHNRAGSNLLRGVASTLITNSSLSGALCCRLALWEADEAALLPISKQLQINTLVLLNLFRDQLDRYGEIDTTRKKWQEVVKNLKSDASLILNTDDPSVNYLSKFTKSKKIFFGLETTKIDLPKVENVADVKFCPNCQAKLKYEDLYSAHLGTYKCSRCSFKRENPQVSITSITFNKNYSTNIKISINKESLSVNYQLPGLFNAYNVMAALASTIALGINVKSAAKDICKFTPVFGRYQNIMLDGKNLLLFLIKNPAGANEVIRTIAAKEKINLLLILNDNTADGRDVSWIWDTNWEALAGKTSNIDIAGTRAWDMALRLKYANIKIVQKNVHKDLNTAIIQAIGKLAKDDTLYILPTYTALIGLQAYLKNKGIISWQSQ